MTAERAKPPDLDAIRARADKATPGPDFSQRTLIAACEIRVRCDPADWTQYPDVLARLLAAQESAE